MSETLSKRIYTGPDSNAQYLQELLEKAGIPSRKRNDFESSTMAGFAKGVPGQAQIFVQAHHEGEAVKIARSTFPKDVE